MRVTIGEICKFALAKPSSKNFTGGENLIDRGHIINCGVTDVGCSTKYKILAFCLQTSDLKSVPHEISGEISISGTIESMACSCKAGLGSACKHIVAGLLHCNRHDLETLPLISSTDKKCVWDVPRKSIVQKYDIKPLYLHDCFEEKKFKAEEAGKKLVISNIDENDDVARYLMEEQDQRFCQLMVEENPSSALAIRISGRHELKEVNNNNVIGISDEEMNAIFENQSLLEFLRKLKDLNVPVRRCCEQLVDDKLSRDVHTICAESSKFYSVWREERQFRITVSNAYSLFTYNSNKNPDWKTKSLKYFYGSEFSNTSTKYGLDNEPLAREAYKVMMNTEIVECGLIVSKCNSWLGCSPDGIVLKNKKPFKLIEIKCPVAGKKVPIDEMIKSITSLAVLGSPKNHWNITGI